jgi:hypothetical protein
MCVVEADVVVVEFKLARKNVWLIHPSPPSPFGMKRNSRSDHTEFEKCIIESAEDIFPESFEILSNSGKSADARDIAVLQEAPSVVGRPHSSSDTSHH